MPRPINKTDLLQSSETQFQKLQNLILSLSEQDQESDFSFDPKFLAHQKSKPYFSPLLILGKHMEK